MTRIAEPQRVQSNLETEIADDLKSDVLATMDRSFSSGVAALSDEEIRERGRIRAHDGAVESTYWYMFAMLTLGLYAAFWIVLFTEMNN
ncbi:hypothetical protein [Sporichthya polymorpha]|uniref:hypothetical protein n=1 Tax=Sporichthya polymorpha TaxID=35751 RepID=UPI0003A6B961|nr:hypothetical protein [Sporichthya polymorpha]